MKKDKTRHYETFLGESYPQKLPRVGKVGKYRINNGALTKDPEGIETHSRGRIEGQEPSVKDIKQPSLDEIFEWLGDPDRE